MKIEKIKRFLIVRLKRYITIRYIFVGFIVITVFSGLLSLYTIYSYTNSFNRIIDSLEIAKSIQLELQTQFSSWKTIIVEGKDFSIYKQKIHEYSYNTQHIQNKLFNLGLICKDIEELHNKIIHFMNFYKEMNDTLLTCIVNYSEIEPDQYKKLIEYALEHENVSLRMLDEIVSELENISSERIALLNRYYFVLSIVSFGILTLCALTLSWYSLQRFERFKRKLEFKVLKRTHQLQRINEQLSLSEQKYKFLLESIDDIIFTIDPFGTIMSVNSSIKKELKIKPEEALGKNVYEFIHIEDDTTYKRQLLIQNISESLREKNKISFYAELKTHRMIEPVEMLITLQKVEVNGQIEIIGKATKVLEDELIASFKHEHVKYEIHNSLMLADVLTHRIVMNAKKFLPYSIVSQLRMAISELLINAIEHGNLEITYQDKMEKLQNNEYFEYLSKKVNEGANKNKKVYVEFLINSEKLVVKITDQGKGFDYTKFLKNRSHDSSTLLQHGRGIMLAQQIFDEIRYNVKGNQVLCVKYIQPNIASNDDTSMNMNKDKIELIKVSDS